MRLPHARCLWGIALLSSSLAIAPAAPAQRPDTVALLVAERGLPGAERADLTALVGALRDRGFEADLVADPAALSAERYAVVLGDTRVCSADAVHALEAYIGDGGRFLSLTAPAFANVYGRFGEEWLDEAGLREKLAAVPAETPLWPDLGDATFAEWRFSSHAAGARNTMAPSPGPDGQAGFTIRFGETKGWDSVVAPAPPGAYGPEQTLSCFWARGDANTRQISIELAERDGARWVAVVDLTEDWRHYALPPSAFHYWPDNPSVGRGGSGDQVRLPEVTSVQFGVSQTHTPLWVSGPHVFSVAEFGPAVCPYPPDSIPRPPVLETLSPAYKLGPVDQPVTMRAAPGQSLVARYWVGPTLPGTFAPVTRPQGLGFERGGKWRWLPIVSAVDANGTDRGAAGWLLLPNSATGGRSAWGGFGFRDLRPYADPAVLDVLCAMTRTLASGDLLFEAGAAHFLYHPGEPVRVGAVARSLGGEGHLLGLSARIEAAGSGRIAWSGGGAVRPTAPAGAGLSWNTPPLPAGEYRVVTELSREGRVVDSISHQLTVAEVPDRVDPSKLVRVEGDRFTLGGKPWFAVGCNYWSSTMAGLAGPDYWGSWLASWVYDPVVVEADLSRMEAWGLKVVAAVCADLRWSDDPAEFGRQCRNLEDFLMRCEAHRMKAYVFLAGANPFGLDPAYLRRIIEGAHLDRSPAILAYDINWEPFFGNRRTDLDPDWERWVVSRYGSIEAAEEDWGSASNRRPDGGLTAPSDQQCQVDGAWRVMVAAYRRAFSDILGERYAAAARAIRAVDPNHLVSFRAGALGWPGGFPHLESLAVRKYVDFLCPECYGLEQVYGQLTPPDLIRRGGLVTRYYAATARKPVVWMEFAAPIYPNGTPWSTGMTSIGTERLDFQVREYESFLGMFLESGAMGCMSWWYPGGYRVAEGSDCGLTDALNQPRPVASTLAEGVRRFYARGDAAPDRWIDIDAEATSRGAWGELGDAYDEYVALTKAGHRVGVRVAGAGTDSVNTPALAVGNVPMTGANPPRFLNALFTPLEVQEPGGEWREVRDGDTLSLTGGRPLRLRASVGNVGEAAWVPPAEAGSQPGGVGLRITFADGREEFLPIQDRVESFGDASMRFSLREPGTATIQMVAGGRSAFGPRVVLTVTGA